MREASNSITFSVAGLSTAWGACRTPAAFPAGQRSLSWAAAGDHPAPG